MECRSNLRTKTAENKEPIRRTIQLRKELQQMPCRLISWQCKKQTVVANSTTEAEYVAASSCCGQVLWIQNQLLDYGYNFMHTKIYIDNESTICIVKNPVFHSKTKHIEIRHHFIRDSNEKKLIQMIKIHTDKNVADLLTKAFDVNYPVWEVIQNGNGLVSISTDTQGQIKILPPKSAEEILARERERKTRTTLLMALLEDHLARFHNIFDAEEMKRSRTGMQEQPKALLTIDAGVIDWSGQAKEEEEDHALMAFNSNSLSNKDETSGILKDFIRQIENQLNQKVKTIRCDNGTEFKNKDVIEFCGSKGIKREYSNARTPQQNGVAERKNRTLIEAARTMLADSFLPNTFWAEAVSTACYVLNRVLVTKPHNKTPYELLTGKGPTWLFDLDYLTDSMNYHPVRSENQANIHAGQQEANHNAGTEDIIDAGDSEKEDESAQDCFVLPIWSSYSSTITPDLKTDEKREGPREEEQVFLDELERLKRQEKEANEEAEALRKEFAQATKSLVIQAGAAKASSTNIFSTVSTPAKASSSNLINTVSTPVCTASPHEGLSLSDPTNPEQDDSEIPPLEDIYQNSTDGIFTNSSYDDEGAVADFTNLETIVNVSPIPTSRINSSHPSALILRDPNSVVQTRSKVIQSSRGHAFVSYFKIQKVWILLDLPYGRKAISTKWVYQNKKDERGVVVRNKARLVAQGHRQEEGIDCDEVFASMARIEAIRIFLAFASYMGFIVYQMDVKSAFLYGKIDEENGYRRGTIDKTLFIKKDKHDIILVQVYVDDIIFGSTNKSWCDEFEALMKSRFQMSSMGELTFFLGLQVKQKANGIFISQDKYVAKILKKFNFTNVKTASTPIETQKPLVKDEEASDVDVHLYRSMIGSLMYLTASRPDIMFAVCACSRVSSFDLESNSDSDYAGANLDRKSTTGGCQFLGRRLISWQCKKQTIVATSTTEAEYVAAASCCGQVLWIQNQMDAYEKKLIQVLKIHTDDNVADLLTKAFDVSRESLRRVFDGTEALMLPTLFILWLAIVSTDSAELVPLGKVCTAIETLKKNTAKALISLSPTITLSNTMAVLESCPKHNMVAYLEKTEGNAEFHDIIDFLTRSSIHHALTVSPVVSTTFVEQFWTSAKSKIINNVRHITAKVAGKPVSISEASIRSDLLFDDANGIDSLPNQAIFDAIQLMGYEGDLTVLTFNKALFSPQWRFLFHTMNHCISSKSTSWDQIPTNISTAVICLSSNQKYNFSKLIFDGMLRHLDAKKKFVMYPRFISIFLDKQLANVPVPLDHFPVNALTSKVFSFMVKKGKHFSGKVTPLFASMLVQPTEDEGAPSERPFEAQATPSPPHTSEVPIERQPDPSPTHTSEVLVEPQTDPSPRPLPSTTIPDSLPESSGGNLRGHSSSDKSLLGNKGDMTLQSIYDLCISLCTQVSDQAKEILKLKAQIKKLKKQAKPGRKSAKGEPSVHKDPLFDKILEDSLDNMETEDAQDMGRTRDVVDEEKENAEDLLSTEDVLSTAQQKVSTDKEKVSTNRPIVSTDGSKVSTNKQKDSIDEKNEGTDDQIEGTDEQSKGTDDHTDAGSATQSTQPPTSIIFGDDETIAQVLLNMSQAKAVSRENEKGVEFKDIEETERPRPTSTRSL
ncbi:putative ribonuclease H-like domain-containing protein, partial [Tanacetum coccineum]